MRAYGTAPVGVKNYVAENKHEGTLGQLWWLSKLMNDI